MKIIQSFLLLTVGLCASTIIYAQEIKPDINKKPEEKIPADHRNKPSTQPESKPQLQDAPVAPSPSKPIENATLKENKNDMAHPGGEAGRKIMEGNTSNPKDPIFSPSTTDAKLTVPIAKPAKSNRQQQ